MADESDVETSSNQNILYDLSVLAEWKFDNEQFTRNSKDKPNASLINRVSSLTRRSVWTFLRSAGIPVQMPTPCLLPEQLLKLKSSQNPWRFAVSSTGNWVAVAQESCIETRSLRDGLESAVGRGTFGNDPYPQWRCVTWNEDESMVACSRSSGAVDVFDILGTLLFTISTVPDDGMTPFDLSDAVSALIFTDFKPEDEKWSYELLITSHHGTLSSYLVDRDNGFQLRYTFLFSTHYPRGISSVCYSPQFKMLLVGGTGLSDSSLSPSKARQEGITAWRLLSDAPYCKLITDYEEDIHKAKSKVSVLSKLKVSSMIQWNSVQVDGIFSLCLSPCNKTLVALHFSGKLSLWDVPSLRPRKDFPLEEQPGWDEISPHLLENPTKYKRVKDLVPHRQLLDVNFWSEECLILARCTGAVSVVSTEDLQNLLGKSPEWYEPCPQVTQALNGGFMGLECEIRFPKKRIHMINPDNEDEEGDDSDEEDASLMSRTTRMSKQVLYYLTDSERFQPPKKKPKFVTKLYRIVQLKSTTPEELYARKIEAEEYGEALALAQVYKLDCDLVYQRQWRKSEVSLASIQDYLNKISKRAWILHECLQRVPDTIDAMRELLQYGLSGTDLSALLAIEKGEDGGRFILCDPDEGLYEDIYDEFNPESQRQKEEKRAQIRQSLLDQIDFTNLNLEEKELCRARLKFLQYMDRLKTYECILGGPNAAADRYNAAFFTSFRSRNIFELAAEYAQNSDWKAVETLMTFHSSDLASHRLAILSNFPETTDPTEYRSLLPEIGEDGEVIPWEADAWRDPDWSETPVCKKVIDLGTEDEAQFLYANFESKYRTETLSKDLVQQWYFARACEIEKKSRLIDNAIEFVKLATERGAENLSDLLDDLMVMDLMVYECGVDDSLTFDTLQEMADYDRLEYIMSQSSEEMYAKNIRRWMVPFLQRCEQRQPMAYSRLLRDFILTKSRNDLTLVLKIFEASKPNVPSPVIHSEIELMTLVMDSLYSCERSDQLDLAIKIFECLPISKHDKESQECMRLHKQVDRLEQHISAAKILHGHGINKTLASIKESENNPEEAKSLFTKLTRLASKRPLPLSDLEWHKLHEDVMSLQSKVYHCIAQSVCHEIFVESLMCSGRQETIHLAGQMLERSSVTTKPNQLPKVASTDKVPYSRAVELVLCSAKEYFDSSANLNDPCMDLARSCLNLILDSPQPIQEELDLIASLALLDEFGVPVLPLQVRLSKNRLELVAKAVTTKPTSYKQTQRLLRLGHLLCIPYENNEREGIILQMCAEAAVTALDYEFAFQCCERLINLCHSPAWNVCVRLAEQEGFRKIDAKAKLLSFALTYCTKDMIQPVLQARCLLETQILYEQINKILNEDKESDSQASRESPFSARAAIKQTQQILSSTKKTTSAVLSTMTDAKWWQSAASLLKQPQRHKGGDGDVFKGRDYDNSGFRKQGCHPFYAGIIENCYEDVRAADYWGMPDNHSSTENILSSNLLRTAKLEEMLTQGEKQQPAVEALMDLAKDTMTRDTTLGLAYLLAIPKDYDFDSCFDSFPSTDISLQLAVYFYAVQVYSTMQPYTPPHVYALYRQTPSKIIGRVFDYIANSSEHERPEEVRTMIKKLQMKQEMLEDFNQACTLQKLGKGVDVIRFADDNEYKRETIFGLAMSLDDEVYNIALSLAKRYDLPMWDVYLCHLEYLFSDSGLSTEELQTRVNKLDVLSTLKERSSEFTQRMMSHIYPTLAGTDMRGLAYFFSLLETCEDKVLCGLTPADHAALLRKLKPACPGLDYKKLMDSDTSPLDVLRSCLTAANINTLAKLSTQIPDKKGGFLNPSSIYGCWASQVFWGQDGSQKLPPENKAAWIHRYEGIGEWVQKLLPEDLLALIDNIVFTPTARVELDVPCRAEITKRALKFSKQSGSGKKKKLEDSGKITWEECSQCLQTRSSHLMSLTNDTIQSFAQASDPTFSTYAEKYDLSKGDLQVVELLLVQMILDGQAVELVDDILQVAPPSSLRTRKIVQRAVSLIVKALRGEDDMEEIRASKPWLEVLQMVVENVRKHQDNGGDLVQAEDVMSLLRSFCSDASFAVTPRLDVLKVLEKSFDLSDTERILLTLYRTDALVSSTWSEMKVSEESISSEESRLTLFFHLLDKCVKKDHFLTLCRLLILWPPFSSACRSDPDKNPWVKVFTAILTSQDHGGEIIYMVIKDECSEFPLDDKCTEHMFELLMQYHQPVSAVKVILHSSYGDHLDKGLTALSNLTEGTNEEDLLKLILSRKLSSRVVSMPVYSHLISYVLGCQTLPTCPEYASPFEIASQLYQAGAEAEAGSLLLQARSSHSLLQTFSSALTSAKHWFKKS
ncbi:hypothetical protein BsWGS_01467 [Bradybaena similaris]